jgi:WD40 repeat protein
VYTTNDLNLKVCTAKDFVFVSTLKGHSLAINTAIFSPDCKTVLSCSNDSTIKLWEPLTGELRKSLDGGTDGYILDVAYANDGKRFASAGEDKLIRIWNAETYELL